MDWTELTWRKSSQSAEQNCVIVAISNNAVLVRDSKDPDGPFLALTPEQWNAFIERMKQGDPVRIWLMKKQEPKAAAHQARSSLLPSQH
jgi:predicted secreted Zn-dependent protease